MAETLTRGARVAADVTALLRARNTLLWIVTREEMRVERSLIDACAGANLGPVFWDCSAGITGPDGKTLEQLPDPSAALAWLRDRSDRTAFVMRDLHKWVGDPMICRALRNLARDLQSSPPGRMRAIVVLTPSSEVPPELAGHATVIDWPLPDRTEIAKILTDVIESLPEEMRVKVAPNGTRDAAIDAAVGLSAAEAENCYARSLVTAKRIDPAIVAGEKKRVIAREKVLTWHDPDPRGLDAVGGLDLLKPWLKQRKLAFGAKARAYGLPAPKGMMLVGVPGCGKSLTAKAVATAWGMPLLRLDVGAMKSKWVGESEANIRKALQVAEAVSPCVLWLDEVEKAFGGSTGPQGDGGVAADAMGTFLSWMQERQGSVFVIATANDVRSLPPEFLRKGRFDEVFWVDLPTASEREAIVRVSCAGRKCEIDVSQVAEATAGYTGAEIAALVPDALFAAFADGERELTTDDLIRAAASVVPLSKTAGEKINALRDWAKGKARPASTPEAQTQGGGRKLDL